MTTRLRAVVMAATCLPRLSPIRMKKARRERARDDPLRFDEHRLRVNSAVARPFSNAAACFADRPPPRRMIKRDIKMTL